MIKKRELLKNTFIIFLGKMCTQTISFFLLPLYTNFLLTEEYGQFDLIITYISLLVPVLSLQLDMANFRFLVDSRNNRNEQEKIISNNLLCLTILIIFLLPLYIIINLFINIQFKLYILGVIIANMISSNFMQISRGIGENIDYSISCVISSGVTILLNIVFIVGLKMGVQGMLLSMLIANITCSIFLFIKLKIAKKINYRSLSNDIIKQMLNYSVPLIPNSISWWIINASDRTIINILIGASANGIYAISNKFPSIISAISNIFNLSWTESASLHINDNDRNEFFSSIFNDVLKLFGSFSLLLTSIVPFIFKILININYNDAYYYIPILILSSLFGIMASQYGSIYVAKKETKKIAYTSILSATLNITIHLALIKKIGLLAAALSTLLSYLIVFLYRFIDSKKYIDIKYDISTIIKISIMFIIVFATYYLNIFYLNIFSLLLSIFYLIRSNSAFFKSIKIFLRKKVIKYE